VPGDVHAESALRPVSSMEPAIADVRTALTAAVNVPLAI
jgi:hypothetical protein